TKSRSSSKWETRCPSCSHGRWGARCAIISISPHQANMPLRVVELFGYPPDSEGLPGAVASLRCPFIDEVCRKRFSNGMPSGLCSAAQSKNPEAVICCPQRLYADDYAILRRVS